MGFIQPFLESLANLLSAIFPAMLPFLLIIMILNIIRYLLNSLRRGRFTIPFKPITVRAKSLTASSDYSLSKPEILGTKYELMSMPDYSLLIQEMEELEEISEDLLYCPNCEVKLNDSDAFFCVFCGYQLIKPKAEWVD